MIDFPDALREVDCRSGYEYAERHYDFWRNQPVNELEQMTSAYLESYKQTGNRMALGMAMYLSKMIYSDVL